jgi:alpha-glucosidase
VWLANVTVAEGGAITLPLYARAGAIIPMMAVDDGTLNALGERSDHTRQTDLLVRIFPSQAGEGGTEFTLFEDDGETTAYQAGGVRTTRLTQVHPNANTLSVTVDAAAGSYNGAPTDRNVTIDVTTDDQVTGVRLNGAALPHRATLAEFQSNANGWVQAAPGTVLAKSGILAVGQARTFELSLTPQPACGSRHNFISVPGAGNGWSPTDATRRLTHCTNQTWTGQVALYQEEFKFAADGSWTVNWGRDGQQGGPNFAPLADAGIYDVSFNELDAAHPQFTRVGSPPPQPLRFSCKNGTTTPGISVYVTGNTSALGGWDTAKAVKLEPNGPYPTWTGLLPGLNAADTIEWKCIKRQEQGTAPAVIQWEPGANNVVDVTKSVQEGEF